MVMRVLPFALVLLATAFAVLKFLFVEGGSRHIDTRWLYAASACVLEGQSPYNIAQFKACWGAATGDDYMAPFVFGMPLLALIWPFGYLPKDAMFAAFDYANVGAIIALAVTLTVSAEPSPGPWWQRYVTCLWVALGVSVGGISGSAYVGQPTVFVALGVAALYLATRQQRDIPFGLATLVCLVKPHITLLPLCVAWLARKTGLTRGKILAALGLAAILFAVSALQGNLVEDYLASLRSHGASAAAKLNDPSRLFGIPGVLSRNGTGLGAIMVLSGAGLGLLIGAILPSAGLARWDGWFLGALILGLFVFPVKAYDFAVLAVGFAIVARQPVLAQLIFILPMLVFWRPRLVMMTGASQESMLTLVTLLGLLIAFICLGSALKMTLMRRRSEAAVE